MIIRASLLEKMAPSSRISNHPGGADYNVSSFSVLRSQREYISVAMDLR